MMAAVRSAATTFLDRSFSLRSSGSGSRVPTATQARRQPRLSDLLAGDPVCWGTGKMVSAIDQHGGPARRFLAGRMSGPLEWLVSLLLRFQDLYPVVTVSRNHSFRLTVNAVNCGNSSPADALRHMRDKRLRDLSRSMNICRGP